VHHLFTLFGLSYDTVLSNSVAARGEDETTFSFKDSTVADLHDDIDVDGLVIELKLLKNVSTSFVLCTFEAVRDVSKALTPALRRIYRSTARQLRLCLAVPMSNVAVDRSFRA